MSESTPEQVEASEAVGPPETLSGRLERLASQRPGTSQLREPLEQAADDASALEADLTRSRRDLEAAQAGAEAHRVERVALEQRVVDAESAAEELHERLDDAEVDRDAARERLAQLEAEVQRLSDPDALAFARRLQAFEAVGHKHAPADGAAELLRMAQWLAEGSLDAVVELQPVYVEDVIDWLHGKVVAVDVLNPDNLTTWHQTGLVVTAVHTGGAAGADLTLRGPAGELDEDGRVKRS